MRLRILFQLSAEINKIKSIITINLILTKFKLILIFSEY